MSTVTSPSAVVSIPATVPKRPISVGRTVRKTIKRLVPTALGIYFIPWLTLAYFSFGLLDVIRNKNCTIKTLDRYFFGNGVFTCLLAPFNLLMDLVCWPFWNRGIYKLNDLPESYRNEIQSLIDAARDRDLVGMLATKMQEKKRGMVFYKWYGKNIDACVDMPEYHQSFKHIRTIGVSIFNKKQSTGEHFGPLRVTLRVLYNINDIRNRDVFISVGQQTHFWQDEKLFIFDDTLLHRSCNESDSMRYCLFVDILRPSPWPLLMSSVLAGIRLVISPYRAVFYKHWTFLK